MDLSAYKAISIGGVPLKLLTLDGTVIWRRPITNWVRRSIDTDGSIYNGVGYLDGYRLSSSGGVKVQSGSAVSGFIPCKKGDIVQLARVGFGATNIWCYICLYDAEFGYIGSRASLGGSNNNYGSAGTITLESDGTITTFTITGDNESTGDTIAYLRINGEGAGADMIITINEEIE